MLACSIMFAQVDGMDDFAEFLRNDMSVYLWIFGILLQIIYIGVLASGSGMSTTTGMPD